MSEYLYRAPIFTRKIPVGYGVSQAQNETDLSDFESNHKASAVYVNEVVLIQTTFITDQTYQQFKANISTPITWGYVKYCECEGHYYLNLLTESPL